MYKIAVVDDNEDWSLAIKHFFVKEFEVFTFNRISSFLRSEELYDLVLVDFSIPPAAYEKDMNGCDLINQIKENTTNPPILVLITGFISKNNLDDLVKEICPLADAFLAKDTGLDEILKQVKLLIASKRKLSTLALGD